jgi:hypothetical protein
VVCATGTPIPAMAVSVEVWLDRRRTAVTQPFKGRAYNDSGPQQPSAGPPVGEGESGRSGRMIDRKDVMNAGRLVIQESVRDWFGGTEARHRSADGAVFARARGGGCRDRERAMAAGAPRPLAWRLARRGRTLPARKRTGCFEAHGLAAGHLRQFTIHCHGGFRRFRLEDCWLGHTADLVPRHGDVIPAGGQHPRWRNQTKRQ